MLHSAFTLSYPRSENWRNPIMLSFTNAFLRLVNYAQAFLTTRQFSGDQAIGNIGGIRFLSQTHQLLYFALDPTLEFGRMPIAQRVMLRSVGLDLRPIDTDTTDPKQAALARDEQDLFEERLQLWQEPPSKIGDRIVLGILICGNVPESDGSYVAGSSLRDENVCVAQP
jgi:hypothetical protein